MSDPKPTIDWTVARCLAAWSALAYQEADVYDTHTGAAAIVRTTPDGDIIVAFRGSKSAKDFIHDAEAWFSELMWSDNDVVAEVHHGFLEDFEAVNVEVVQRVRALIAVMPKAPVFVTGHSLGGALAKLCALEFSRQKIDVTGVYTFGAPRVGNRAFREIYNRSLFHKTFRVVNQNDLVPRLPGYFAGYRHTGMEFFMLPGTGYIPQPALWEKIIADIFGLYGAYRHRDDVLITEHFIRAYQERMKLV